MVRDYNLWGCRDLFKRNMERHPEGFGDALQLLYRDIFLATADSVQVLLADAQPGCQFCFTHVFLTIAFFRSILVLGFIIDLFKPPPSSPSRGGLFFLGGVLNAQHPGSCQSRGAARGDCIMLIRCYMTIFPICIFDEKKTTSNNNNCHCINNKRIHCIHFLFFLRLPLLSFSLLYITAKPDISNTKEKIATI